MRRIIFFPKVVLIMLLVLNTSLIAGTYSGGNGTEISPYQIANLNDLQELQNTPADWDAHFIQTADIDASPTSGWDNGAGFLPIGNENKNFTGLYDGAGHTINNMHINRRWTENIGLFGHCSGATIKNLGLSNLNIIGGTKTGGLAGFISSNTSISNCHSSGQVSGYGYYAAGGLVGENKYSGISDCYSSTTVFVASGSGGGLVGFNSSNAIVTNCYSLGSVTGSYEVGGLVGLNYSTSKISNSYSLAIVKTVTSWADQAGGLVGINGEASTISNCYSTGDVFRDSTGTLTDFGGFCGSNNASTIEYCYSTGSVYFQGTTNPTDKGFVGTVSGSVTHTANFWDNEKSNQSSALGAEGRTTSEMHTQSTFTNAGWDFMGESTNGTNDYWTMDVSGVINHGYAILFWQTLGYTSVEPEKIASGHLPDRTELEAAYPNPFNPQTKIRYRLAKNATVRLVVYNALGQRVKRLVAGALQSAGSYEILWNALDDGGEMLPSGTYIVVLKAGGYIKSEKVLLLH